VRIVCAIGVFVLAGSGAFARAQQPQACDLLPANPAALAPDLVFTADDGIRVDHAALPKPFVDESGRVHLFYERETPPVRGMYAISSDGLTFTGNREQAASDLQYHPFRVRMPNGVWRMFSWDPRQLIMTTRSSGDGAVFSADPGVRYSLHPDDRGWMGIHEEYVDGRGRVVMLYLGDKDGLNNLRRAVSTDNGWTFTFDRGDVLGDSATARQNGPGSAYVDQKSIYLDGAARRLFVMKQGCAIYSFLTTDGDVYALEPGYRVSVRSWPNLSLRSLHDPVVVRLPDGRFRMYVAAALNETPLHQVILTATTR
jgi:hypothetical protein